MGQNYRPHLKPCLRVNKRQRERIYKRGEIQHRAKEEKQKEKHKNKKEREGNALRPKGRIEEEATQEKMPPSQRKQKG